jgi:hypothetical protein
MLLDAEKCSDLRANNTLTVCSLIDRYTGETGGNNDFGKNQKAVLKSPKVTLSALSLATLADMRMVQCSIDKIKADGWQASLSIDLQYIGPVLKATEAV